jgi:hypothetical protein
MSCFFTKLYAPRQTNAATAITTDHSGFIIEENKTNNEAKIAINPSILSVLIFFY